MLDKSTNNGTSPRFNRDVASHIVMDPAGKFRRFLEQKDGGRDGMGQSLL